MHPLDMYNVSLYNASSYRIKIKMNVKQVMMIRDNRKLLDIKNALLVLHFTVLFALFNSAFGNDSAYYGSGVTVYPVKHDNIQLVSEVITITKGVGLGWGVEASLNFKNHGKKTSVQMGFPFDTDGPNDPEDKEEDVPDPKFRTFIDSKEIKVIKKKGWSKSPLQDLNFPIVYTFTVSFEQGETKTIRHTYSVQGTEWSTGDYEFKYILKTGALWRGVIENVKVAMILPGTSAAGVHCVLPKEHKATQNKDAVVLSWEFQNIKPKFNITAKTLFGREPIGLDYLRTTKDLFITDACCVRYFRNLVYASYGYPFENPYPRMQFYGSGLFHERNDFNINMITRADKKVLDDLTNYEHRYKPK